MQAFNPIYSLDGAVRIARSRAIEKAYELHMAEERAAIEQDSEPWEKRNTVPHGKIYRLLGKYYPNYSLKMLYNLMRKYMNNERVMPDDMLEEFSTLVYGEGNENFIYLDAYIELRSFYDTVFYAEARRSSYLGRKKVEVERILERKAKTLAEFYDQALTEHEEVDEWQ